MLLTPEQLQKIAAIIEKHHNAFIISAIGPEAVPPEVLKALEAAGLIEEHLNSIEQAYLYGQLLSLLQTNAAAKMSFPEFQKYVRQHPVPLSEAEQRAVKFAQFNAAGYIKGLGNKVNQQTGQLMINADKALEAKLQKIVRDKIAENIAKRETFKQLRSDLGWASEDWTRDWDRIAITEKQNAMQTGMADHIVKRYGPKALVAKRTMPDACKHCKRLFDGPDGNPRIFPLSVLVQNGTNVGKKAADWEAVIGTVHPHCQCQLIRVPDGWGFNADGELVPGGEGGKVYKSEDALALALLREDDLQKSLRDEAPVKRLFGLPIHIENPVGSEREWHTPDGGTDKTWMRYAYGEIVGTEGMDADPMDVFIGPDPDAEMVYIVEQQNPSTGIWDEQKCMLGFPNQDIAELAYRMHYDHPGKFFIQISPMTLDAFQRWIGMERRGSAEEKPGVRLVIPLPKIAQKSDNVPGEYAAAVSPAGNRAVAGYGANYLVETPKRRVPEKGSRPGIDPTKLVKEWNEEEQPLRRDKRTYHVTETLRNVHPITLPDHAITGQDDARKGTKKRRRYVIGNAARLAQRPKDKAEIDQEQDFTDFRELAKSFAMQAVIATGPRGGKIVGWNGADPIYLRDGQQDTTHGWTHRLAHHLGGKVSEHKQDQNAVMLKVKPEHGHVLQHLQEHFSLPEKVMVGSNYHMLSVPKAKFEEIENADPYGVFPESEQPKPKAKGKKAPKLTIPHSAAPAEKPQRQGDIQLVPPESLKPPNVSAKFICKGASVMFHGKPGKFVGNDQWGNFIINRNGVDLYLDLKTEAKEVTSEEAGPEHYKMSTAALGKECFVRANERQQKLLDEMMQEMPVVGPHKAQEYIDWFQKAGREAYVVGGALRDLFHTTKPGDTSSDEDIRKQLKDVDIVVTAHGGVIQACMEQVGHDMGKFAANIRSDPWVTYTASHTGPGVDITSMVSFTTSDGKQGNNPVNAKYSPTIKIDHEMHKDFERRDFTCNCIYYDARNKVVVDPTGQGIADAQAGILRLPIPVAEMPQNDSISCRFWKFRMRGWQGDPDTKAQMVAHFEHTFSTFATQVKERGDILYRTVCKKGGTPKENLAKLRAIMAEDGAGHLYDEYVGKEEKAIVTYIETKIKKQAEQDAKDEKEAAEAKQQLGLKGF